MATLATTTVDASSNTATTITVISPISTEAIITAPSPTYFTIYYNAETSTTEVNGDIESTVIETSSIVTNISQYYTLATSAAAAESQFTSILTSVIARGSPIPPFPPSSSASSPASTTSATISGKASLFSLGTIILAVVAPIVFFFAVGLGWILLKRRQKSKCQECDKQSKYDKPELDTTEISRTHGWAELQGMGDAEVLDPALREKNDKRRHAGSSELPGSLGEVAELDSGTGVLQAEARRNEG